MARQFEVDQFLTPDALEAFAARQDVVWQTVGALILRGLDSEHPALGFGGGALAAQSIDSYVGGDKPFDLDVVVMPPMFDRLRDQGTFTHMFTERDIRHGVILPGWHIPMPVDVFTSEDMSNLLHFTGGVPYRGFSNAASTRIDDVNWVTPGVVASTKSMSAAPRVRDLSALVKAQVVAHHIEHPIQRDVMWVLSVGSAVGKLLTPGPWEPQPPSWVTELVQADFNHPAFANIPRL
jgi:hypothetical protein